MNEQYPKMRRLPQLSPQWWAAPIAFVATLMALPVNAGITIPSDPLTTGVRVAPNVLFILDDSGSMAFDYMPGDACEFEDLGCAIEWDRRGNPTKYRKGVSTTKNVNVSSQTYTRNTLYYNPGITYSAWTKADKTLMTGGTSYSTAYGSFNLVGGTTINLGSSSSCKKYNYNNGTADNDDGKNSKPSDDEPLSGGRSVCGGVQTFYVPRDTTRTDESYLGDGANYYRYQILSNGSDVKRGVYGKIVAPVLTVKIDGANVDSGTLNANTAVDNKTAAVSAGVRLDIKITNDSSGCSGRGCTQPVLSYKVYSPSGVEVCNGSVNRGGNKICSVEPTSAGQYKITVQSNNASTTTYELAATTSTTNSCDGLMTDGDYGWIDCESELPNKSKRDTVAKELVNYATWFSYHRTRMKAAKAGASLAFAGMDSRIRAGFRTIWRRDASKFDIPVKDGNDGRFINNVAGGGASATTTRTQWYDKLFGVIGYHGTPLKGALQSAGEYFKGDTNAGPYGPESGSNQYSCRQNFAILTTDGYWNNDDGFTKSSTISNSDNSDGDKIGDPASPGTPYQYTPTSPYKDDYGSTLADVAMYYWKTDLRTDSGMGDTTNPKGNNVPTSDDDPAFWQHMVTFGISIGLNGTVDQTTVKAVKDKGNPTVGGVAGWPKPVADTATAIDDLLHAAVNGHGSFIAATDPAAFASGLKAALSTISKRTSSFSNVATNSASLRSGSMVFNASYVSGVWTGDVKAYAITASGVSSTAKWSANFPEKWSDRKIYTAGGTFPTAAQTTALDRNAVGLDYRVTGINNANYIKGDQSLEGSDIDDLRERSSILGDIIGSSPEFVEDTNTLYVGANDGMLHAFNATTGAEQFAYVPGILDMGLLSSISRGDYSTMHKFLVDGPIVVSPRSLTPGQNIVVGSLGRGGKGLYALSVNDPATINGSPALWEKTSASAGYDNLGLVLSRPVLAKAKTGAAVAIVSNGVNSVNDKAVLLVVDLASGGVIKEINTGAGSSSTPNGLFAPTGVLGSDGSLDYVYAGDMLGNLWRFDLKSTNIVDWKATKLFAAKVKVAGVDVTQPITGGVTVATDPKTFKRWVFFGTGRYLTQSDATDNAASAQGMYGIIDDGTGGEVSYNDLTLRKLTGSGDTRTADTKAELSTGNKMGWYILLPGAGERIVQDAQVVSNVLVTASMMPTSTGCDSGGSGYINAVDAFTGTSTGSSFFDTNGDGTANSSDTVVGSMNYGVGMPTLPIIFSNRIVVGGTGGSGGGGGGKPVDPSKMNSTWNKVSWVEIRQD